MIAFLISIARGEPHKNADSASNGEKAPLTVGNAVEKGLRETLEPMLARRGLNR
jgi:hypothetical protein